MKPYYRVIRCTDFTVSQQFTKEEAIEYSQQFALDNPGVICEIAVVIGQTMIPLPTTFWYDGCVDTSQPGG